MVLKRYLPKSLLGRALTILGAPIVLVQIIAMWVFYDTHLDAVTRNMARTLSGEIGLALHMAEEAAGVHGAAARSFDTSDLSRFLNLHLTWRAGQTLDPASHVGGQTRRGRELIIAMQALNAPFRVDTETRPRQVHVLVQGAGGVLEVVTSDRKLGTVTADVFVAWSIGSAAVLLAIAFVFMRNLVKPIRKLAEAADALGKGGDVPDFKPYGAREVRRAAAAFLIMRDRLKRQLKQRTEMLAGVSHDLRTPLTRMKLQLALLGNQPEAAGLAADVAEMEQMVDEYLAFARGEGAEQAVPVNLPDVLEDLVEVAQRNGSDVTLRTKGPLEVALRPNGFRRCISNLIANAGRFGSRIQLQAARRANFVEITVDDDGPGVPEEKREEVFRPFYRLDDDRNRGTGGSGLGLTIARDIVRGHGGDILLADSPLGGLRVVVRLPL
jgi:two-component system osmolarity sensor histidine kinase EnvZ